MGIARLLVNAVTTALMAFVFTRWVFSGDNAQLNIAKRRLWFAIIWVIFLALAFFLVR